MQLKSIKTAAEAPFAGVEFVKVDGAITEVIIGGKLRIRKGESYSANLQVLVAAPGEVAKRYRVAATLEGFAPTVEYHENSYDADERQRHFEKIGATVEKTYADVLITESGAQQTVELVAPAAADLEEIPF